MDINKVKMMIRGEWKYSDGRIIEFLSNDEYIIKDDKGKPFYDEPHKIFYNKSEKGHVIISMPLVAEPMAVLTLLSNDQLIYDSYYIDSTKEEYILTKVQ